MSAEDLDAEELFKRIQRNLLQVEEEDDAEPVEFDPSRLQIDDEDEAEPEKVTLEEQTQPDAEQKDKLETKEEPENVSAAKEKVYQFTEVSSGVKRDIRRFSQSKQFTGLQSVQTHNPLLRSQDISAYKPSTAKLDELLKRIQKRNQDKLEVMKANQVVINNCRRTSSRNS